MIQAGFHNVNMYIRSICAYSSVNWRQIEILTPLLVADGVSLFLKDVYLIHLAILNLIVSFFILF